MSTETNTRIEKATIEAGLVELADELGRVPTANEWDEWPDSPCHESYVRKRYDGWTPAIDAAGLPVLPAKATEIIRQIAYQRPDLAGRSSEVYDK